MNAQEIRDRIVSTVMKNGGHLASSLGAVEIAMALRKVFDPEKDRILWDVGHQAYAWKLLTGREDRFDTLRQLDGLAPFPTPLESKADAAVSGHAGSAFSVAVGLAAARDLKGTDESVVAVVGDASMANGHSFEALNNCAAATKKLILVLNDNEMSISRPVGAFAKFLGRMLASEGYNRVKLAAESTGHRMKLTFLREAYHRLESRVKGLFLGNRFFEQFGLRYIGPVDGHDLKALEAAFAVAKRDKRSVLVHVVTVKGKGYEPAEKDPTKYHGVPAGGKVDLPPRDAVANRPDWSEGFGHLLVELAREDDRVVAITAGMKTGTGLEEFAREFPHRFFDVGIAEGHMVSFAAGLAANGMRPFVAVYSTFLQRAVDQVIHDVALAKLPVVFCVDRAGVVGADGATHHGTFDLALLGAIPNLAICQPCSGMDFKLMLEDALKRPGPTVIRYPRGIMPAPMNVVGGELSVPVANVASPVQLWTTGDELPKAMAVAAKCGCGVVYARYLKPLDEALLARQLADGKRIWTLEDGVVRGGFGAALRDAAAGGGAATGRIRSFGWPDEFIPHGKVAELERRYGLDVDAIAAEITGSLEQFEPTNNS